MNHLPKTEEHYGVIHFDFELDNVIWAEDHYEMIDFEQCSYYWFTADLAFALRDLFEDGCDFSHPHFQSFLKGYQVEKEISENYVEEIPEFLRFHRLFIFATILKALDVNMETNQQNSWLMKLTQRLENYRSTIYYKKRE